MLLFLDPCTRLSRLSIVLDFCSATPTAWIVPLIRAISSLARSGPQHNTLPSKSSFHHHKNLHSNRGQHRLRPGTVGRWQNHALSTYHTIPYHSFPPLRSFMHNNRTVEFLMESWIQMDIKFACGTFAVGNRPTNDTHLPTHPSLASVVHTSQLCMLFLTYLLRIIFPLHNPPEMGKIRWGFKAHYHPDFGLPDKLCFLYVCFRNGWVDGCMGIGFRARLRLGTWDLRMTFD